MGERWGGDLSESKGRVCCLFLVNGQFQRMLSARSCLREGVSTQLPILSLPLPGDSNRRQPLLEQFKHPRRSGESVTIPQCILLISQQLLSSFYHLLARNVCFCDRRRALAPALHHAPFLGAHIIRRAAPISFKFSQHSCLKRDFQLDIRESTMQKGYFILENICAGGGGGGG